MASERCSYTQQYRQKICKKPPQAIKSLFGMGETSGLVRAAGGAISNGNKPPSQQHSEHQKGTTSNRRTSHAADPSSTPKVSTSAGHNPHTARYSAGLNSLIRMASEKRARRVRFYRNGDRFFGGMVCAVSAERFRTFESLLTSLTSSAVCDSRVMPNGVRHIFSVDGARRIESLDQLEEGESYVCASAEVFRSLDYCRNEEPGWNHRIFQHRASINGSQKENGDHHPSPQKLEQSEAKDATVSSASEPVNRPHSTLPDKPPKSARSVKESKSEMSPEQRREYEEYQRTHVVPRLITVIRHGRRPRKAVRLLLNKKTAKSFDQVMEDITDAVRLDTGSVKKIFTLSGRRVTCLADFFQDETIFLACGTDKMSVKDLELDKTEVRQVSAYRPFSERHRERVTLRSSPSSTGSKSSADHLSSAVSATSDKNSQSIVSDRTASQEGKDDATKEEKPPMPLALTNKYDVGSLIGTGNFAVVMECRDKKTNRKYALKIINRDNCKEKQEKMLNNEVRILRSLKHPNIIRLVEDFTSPHQMFYIMELVKGGDLFDAISNSSTSYTEQDASGMMYNLASALEYLHSLHIVHRDVKPENILICQHDDETKSLKLGDFGLATEVKGPQYTVCGTPTYVAPEVIAETGYGVKIDIWSAGVIGYILLCGFPPFSSSNDNQDELFDLIMTGKYDFPSPYWDDITQQAKNVISGMLEIDPDARMSATQVLDHKWVASDTHYDQDLKTKVSRGLSTYFRRDPKSSPRHAGIKIIATTALDKASKYFQGRGTLQERGRGRKH